MTLRIDGDGCPDIMIMEELSLKYHVPMIVYTDSSHVMRCSYAEVVVLDTSSQSVDIALVNTILKGDIVVTQDYGVAVLALSKEAYAIHPNGKEYTNENIMRMLNEKYMHQKLRKQNIHMRGPKKRTSMDTEALCETLCQRLSKQ